MRVLICTDSFYPGIGGTEAACFGFASQLVAEGHDVLLACPDYHRKDEREYPFPVLRLPALPLTKTEVMVYVKFAHKKIKQMAAWRPDIIHVQTWSGMAQIALKLGKKLDVPVLMTMHTQLRLLYKRTIKFPPLIHIFIRDAVKKLRRADYVATVSECMRGELAACGYEKSDAITVIRNGAMFKRELTSDEERLAARAHFSLPADKPVLLFVGHIAQFKRVDFLLRAFQVALEKGFDGRMMLVGRGVDSVRYEELSKQLGLAGHVLFTGQLENREEVKKAYAAADLFVMASIFDNDPLVVVEAASMGVATLALEGTGSSERISDGVNGFVAPSEERAFAARILEICADMDSLRKIGENASLSIPTTWKQTAEQYEKIYQQLLENKRGE